MVLSTTNGRLDDAEFCNRGCQQLDRFRRVLFTRDIRNRRIAQLCGLHQLVVTRCVRQALVAGDIADGNFKARRQGTNKADALGTDTVTLLNGDDLRQRRVLRCLELRIDRIHGFVDRLSIRVGEVDTQAVNGVVVVLRSNIQRLLVCTEG